MERSPVIKSWWDRNGNLRRLGDNGSSLTGFAGVLYDRSRTGTGGTCCRRSDLAYKSVSDGGNLALATARTAGFRRFASLATGAAAGGALSLSVDDDIGLNTVDNVFKSEF